MIRAHGQRFWILAAFATTISVPASAQWTVIDLDPAGSTQSAAYGVSGGQQVGYAVVSSQEVASLWSGTAASWVSLSPAGSTVSQAYGVSAGQQVGYAYFGGFQRAGLWSGTASSWVSLDPAGSLYSSASGLGGGQQVGFAVVGGHSRASLWSGTAASWVDLSPAGSTESEAFGVSGGQQVGQAIVGGQQRASLWSGNAASWVDLTPAGTTTSIARGVSGGRQVGEAIVGGTNHASLWSGNAASWVYLHAFLPPEFTSSEAWGIWQDAAVTYVVGKGLNSATGNTEALRWVSHPIQTITASSTSLAPGIVISGTPADMFTSNDVYYVLRPGIVLSSSQSPIVLVLSGHGPGGNVSTLNMVVESHADQANIRQTIEVYNFDTPSYEMLDQSALLTSDRSREFPIASPSAHIGPGHEVRTRLSYKAVGPILSYPWRVSIDEATWRYTN